MWSNFPTSLVWNVSLRTIDHSKSQLPPMNLAASSFVHPSPEAAKLLQNKALSELQQSCLEEWKAGCENIWPHSDVAHATVEAKHAQTTDHNTKTHIVWNCICPSTHGQVAGSTIAVQSCGKSISVSPDLVSGKKKGIGFLQFRMLEMPKETHYQRNTKVTSVRQNAAECWRSLTRPGQAADSLELVVMPLLLGTRSYY